MFVCTDLLLSGIGDDGYTSEFDVLIQ